jgi:hypothetical protein
VKSKFFYTCKNARKLVYLPHDICRSQCNLTFEA